MSNTAQASAEDRKLKKSLGFWSLLATGVGSVIGSGWLFSAQYAAQGAGPAALVAWVIGGGLMLCVALVFAELGVVRPESGGLVRYPLYSNGRFAAAIVGWSMWISYVGNPPTEAAGVVQYANAYLPGVYAGNQLTPWGILLAVGLLVVFVVINYFGVQLFARTNNIVTAVKIFIPSLAIVMLIASGFDSSNITGNAHGGFAPYGYAASLGTIATAGMVFAYTGFRNIVELSGEAKSPRKTIPSALVVTILFTIVLYLGLQLAFLGAVPGDKLAGGWSGVNFDSPFAKLAQLLGLTWLYWLLIADSMLSPSGAAIVYTASNSRNVFGLAKNGFFPTWLVKIDTRTGVPGRALIFNFLVGLAFLLPLPSWHSIVSITGSLAAFTFSIGSISLLAFRRVGLSRPTDRLPGMHVLAPVAFVVSALVIYWVDWSKMVKIIPIAAIGVVWWLVSDRRGRRDRSEIMGGLWLVVYLIFIFAVSAVGSFGGLGVLPAPWDSVIVAAGTFAIYFWGVAAATTYMEAHPEVTESLRHGDSSEKVENASRRPAGPSPSSISP